MVFCTKYSKENEYKSKFCSDRGDEINSSSKIVKNAKIEFNKFESHSNDFKGHKTGNMKNIKVM